MSDTVFERFRITICGIPELGEHGAAGITHVLSILDPDWPDPEAFEQFGPHHRLALRFHDVIDPQPGMLAPERADVERLLEFGQEMQAARVPHLLVHCHAGVSRSTASAALILAEAYPEQPAKAVVDAVVQVRPRAWPNLRMIEFGDDLLGRRGELVAAALDVYRRAMHRDPNLGHVMTDLGRAREVSAALGRPA